MHNSKVGICITTYNDQKIIKKSILSVIQQDFQESFTVFIVDDGSTDSTPSILTELGVEYPNIKVKLAPHRERGLTRVDAIQMAIDSGCEYFMFLDSDMVLKKDLLRKCVTKMKDSTISGLVIPEIPVSEHDNFMTKVKVFEREIINNVGEEISTNSIEAARFWKTSEYLRSGGLNPTQISFEETQPTIRILELGGRVSRLADSGLMHDEGLVTLKNLLQKKYYYFNNMGTTTESESNGFWKALSRWYFFRPYLYSKRSVCRYFRHPLRFMGLLFMYISLTLVAFSASVRYRLQGVGGG